MTFDVVKERHLLLVGAGEILGITRESRFDVYTSKAVTLHEEPVGQFEVSHIRSTHCTCDGLTADLDLLAAVASPSGPGADTFYVHVESAGLRPAIRKAIEEENPADQFGRPQIDIEGAANSVDLTVAVNDSGNIVFRHHPSSVIGQHRLEGLCYELSAAPSDMGLVRRVLRAAAHFFKYLRNEPTTEGNRLRAFLEVRLHELEETNEIAIMNNKLVRVLKPTKQLVADANGSYSVMAAGPEEDPGTAQPYSIELVNHLQKNGLFVWVFFFDCTTLQIGECLRLLVLPFPRVLT